jgi:hypothetical protein
MKRKTLTSTSIAKRSAFAIAGFVLVATLDVASASPSTGSAGASAWFGSQQLVRLAEMEVVTKPKHVKRTKRPHRVERGPGTNWLNPQPDPPMSAKKPVQGGNWLNPQPEPPRPDTATKKLH